MEHIHLHAPHSRRESDRHDLRSIIWTKQTRARIYQHDLHVGHNDVLLQVAYALLVGSVLDAVLVTYPSPRGLGRDIYTCDTYVEAHSAVHRSPDMKKASETANRSSGDQSLPLYVATDIRSSNPESRGQGV